MEALVKEWYLRRLRVLLDNPTRLDSFLIPLVQPPEQLQALDYSEDTVSVFLIGRQCLIKYIPQNQKRKSLERS